MKPKCSEEEPGTFQEFLKIKYLNFLNAALFCCGVHSAGEPLRSVLSNCLQCEPVGGECRMCFEHWVRKGFRHWASRGKHTRRPP